MKKLNQIDEVKKFMSDFIEVGTDVFSGFPICPFAKKERIENKIKFLLTNFTNIDAQKIIEEVENFLQGTHSTLLLVSNSSTSFEQTKHFFKCIVALLEKSNTNVFLFHEDDLRSYGGVYTRRSPVPFIMVGHKEQIKKKKKQLLKTNYYKKLNEKEMLQLHPRRRKNGKNKTSN